MDGNDVIGRRIGAAFIDIAIVVVLALLVGGIVGNDVASDAPASARFGALDRVLIVCLVFGYYWATETVWGQTLGKRVLDIRVERVDGTKATAGATFVRTLA
ncbi:MAG: RDD family protein [Actinobacteria bacterium]|nr:RDD family protein [Actinomycetota bacterium]